jgi:hypothetical protein
MALYHIHYLQNAYINGLISQRITLLRYDSFNRNFLTLYYVLSTHSLHRTNSITNSFLGNLHDSYKTDTKLRHNFDSKLDYSFSRLCLLLFLWSSISFFSTPLSLVITISAHLFCSHATHILSLEHGNPKKLAFSSMVFPTISQAVFFHHFGIILNIFFDLVCMQYL